MPLTEEEKNQRLIESIDKTGYGFEYTIHTELKRHGWNIIPNRYYVDDINQIEREIDVVAYKSFIKDDIVYYTALIISCKKRADSSWVFLSSENEDDLNVDSFPISIISSDERLALMIQKEKKKILDKIKNTDSFKTLYNKPNRVFAYYQVNNQSVKYEDSKCIYDSIITSIKAMEYEMDAHKNYSVCDGKRTFYSFNLLSVFDGILYEIMHKDDKTIEVKEVDEIKYHNRHIINKKEKFYRVHFISGKAFPTIISQYDSLHRQGRELFSGLIDEFYNNIWEYGHRVDLYRKRFIDDLTRVLASLAFRYRLDNSIPIKSDDLRPLFYYDKTKQVLVIDLFAGEPYAKQLVNFYNTNPETSPKIKNLLDKYFRYKGDFTIIENELPF